MKAAYLERTGDPEVIQYGDLPDPTPKKGEVLIDVHAACLNPIDLYIRAGTIPMDLPKPYIPGCDFAGQVTEIGDGVVRCKPGDLVWGSNQGLLGRQGTIAEKICVEEKWVYPKPDGVSCETAAANALVGITAHLGLFQCAKLQPGETVFVNGGTGGVGSMVVQMTKAHGAQVIATVGSPEKQKLCQSWGADLVLNYKTDDVPSAIAEFTKESGVDVWYETQREPNFEMTIPLLRKRGRMIVMAGRQAEPTFPVGPFYVKDLSLFGFAMFNASPEEQQACAEAMNRWMAEQKLTGNIGQTFEFARAAEAHRFLEENTLGNAGTLVGKVVLVPKLG